MYTFAQRRNRPTTHFSERILVVKRRISVFISRTKYIWGIQLFTFHTLVNILSISVITVRRSARSGHSVDVVFTFHIVAQHADWQRGIEMFSPRRDKCFSWGVDCVEKWMESGKIILLELEIEKSKYVDCNVLLWLTLIYIICFQVPIFWLSNCLFV